MRHGVWIVSLGLAFSAVSGVAARADEGGPIPRPEQVEGDARPEPLEAQSGEVEARLAPNGRLEVAAQDVDVLDVIQKIAEQGKLQVFVAPDVRISLGFFRMTGAPASVLRGLGHKERLEVLKRGEIFLVRRPQATAPEPTPLPGDLVSLDFKNVRVREVVEVLAVAMEAGVVVEVEAALSQKSIPLLKTDNATLKAALESIALALDAQVAWEDGRYILRAKPQ